MIVLILAFVIALLLLLSFTGQPGKKR